MSSRWPTMPMVLTVRCNTQDRGYIFSYYCIYIV